MVVHMMMINISLLSRILRQLPKSSQLKKHLQRKRLL
jgi:ribosomal protein S25